MARGEHAHASGWRLGARGGSSRPPLDHKRRGYHECINANGGLGDGKDGRHAAREKRALVRFSQRAYARAPAERPGQACGCACWGFKWIEVWEQADVYYNVACTQRTECQGVLRDELRRATRESSVTHRLLVACAWHRASTVTCRQQRVQSSSPLPAHPATSPPSPGSALA